MCGRDSNGLYLCQACSTGLRIDLGDVPSLLGDLDITGCRLDRISGPTASRRSAEKPLPFKPQAFEALFILDNTLSAWTRTLDQARTGTAQDNAAWLHENIGLLRGFPKAGDAYDELTYAIREARRVIDRPNDQRRFLGRCGMPTHSTCMEVLYARPRDDKTVCPTCHAEWDVEERRSWMLSIVEDEVETAPTLSALLTELGKPTTVADIQRWAKIGWINWISMDRNRRRRYRVRDVLDVWANQHKEAS